MEVDQAEAIGDTSYLETNDIPRSLQPHDEWDGTDAGVVTASAGAGAGAGAGAAGTADNGDAAGTGAVEDESARCDACHRSFPAMTVNTFPALEGGAAKSRTRPPTASKDVSLCGYCSVGRRAQVWWKDDGQWYGGVLDAYNAMSNLHRIL